MKSIPMTIEDVGLVLSGRKTQARIIPRDNWDMNPGEKFYIGEDFMFAKGADCRESFIGTEFEGALGDPPHYWYRASNPEKAGAYPGTNRPIFKWRDACKMPECAARIFCEITGVRSEHLLDICHEDIGATGIGLPVGTELVHGHVTEEWNRRAFEVYWKRNMVNAPWNTNPIVIVLDFKTVEKTAKRENIGESGLTEQNAVV